MLILNSDYTENPFVDGGTFASMLRPVLMLMFSLLQQRVKSRKDLIHHKVVSFSCVSCILFTLLHNQPMVKYYLAFTWRIYHYFFRSLSGVHPYWENFKHYFSNYAISEKYLKRTSLWEQRLVFLIINCSAMILDAEWSIGVRFEAVHPLQIQNHTAEFNTTTWSTNIIDITTLTV